MSTVSIAVRRTTDRNATVRALRPLLDLPLVALLHALESQAPLIEVELFMNDFAEVANTLRKLVETLGRLGDDYVVAEDGDDISPELLFNLLEGSEDYQP